MVSCWFLYKFQLSLCCFFTQVPTVPLLAFYTSPNCLLAFFTNLNCPFAVFLDNPNCSFASFLHKPNSPFAVFLYKSNCLFAGFLHKFHFYCLFTNFLHKHHFYCHFASFPERVLSHYPWLEWNSRKFFVHIYIWQLAMTNKTLSLYSLWKTTVVIFIEQITKTAWNICWIVRDP